MTNLSSGPTAGGKVLCRLPLSASLGEGLHWDAEHGVLWGVDIHGRTLWCWDLVLADAQRWTLAQRVGWVLPVAGTGHLLLGLQNGFALVERRDPSRILWRLDPFDGRPALRLNDAKADASGAVWAGSLNNDDESRDDGCLYRLDRFGRVQRADDGYRVANGPAIGPKGRLMLHTDSGRRTIYAFTLDAGTGLLTDKQVWKVFADDEGYPDGMCFDAEGCVWVAHWGAGCVSRFAQDGTLLRRLAIPASQVTNVCFGGAGLDRLFVTTARIGLSAEALAQQPLAGHLFEVPDPGAVGLAGLPAGPFSFAPGLD
jgi:xylono-1,5-lactonase